MQPAEDLAAFGVFLCNLQLLDALSELVHVGLSVS